MDREARHARDRRVFYWLAPLLAAFACNAEMAAHLELQIDGVEGPLRDAAVSAAGLQETLYAVLALHGDAGLAVHRCRDRSCRAAR